MLLPAQKVQLEVTSLCIFLDPPVKGGVEGSPCLPEELRRFLSMGLTQDLRYYLLESLILIIH